MTYPPQSPQDPVDPQAAQQAQWQAQQAQAAQQAQWQAQQAQAAQQQAWAQAQQGYGAPAAPRPNPFAGTPVSDWVRDGAAAVLLLVSLALPWSFRIDGFDSGPSTAASRVDVLLITLLSVLSVTIGYLAKFGVFGAGMNAQTVATIRALVNLPYLLLVVLYVVFDAINTFSNSPTWTFLLGPAVGIGLAGALIAASPRKNEVFSPEFAPTAAKFSYNFFLGYFLISALTTVLGVVFSLIKLFQGHIPDALVIIDALLIVLVPALLVPLLFFVVVRRSGAMRVLALSAGYVALAALFFRSFGDPTLADFESLGLTYGYPLIFLAASVGLLGSPALSYAMQQPAQQMDLWHKATRLAPIVIMVVGGLTALSSIFQIIILKGDGIGLAIGVLICSVLSIAAALVLRIQIISNYQQGRMVIAGIAGAITILGLVAAILQGVDENSFALNFAWILVGYFGAMGALFYVLFSPKEVRDYFKSLQPQMPVQQDAYATGAYDTSQFTGIQPQVVPGAPMPQAAPTRPAAPVPPVPAAPQAATAPTPPPVPAPAPAPAVDPALIARAQDPATSAQEQFELAKQRELWPYLAQNPSLYEDLANWLAQTGDPQVAEILRSRGANS